MTQKDNKDNWVWFCLCPRCHSELPYLAANTPFLKEKYKCPRCKKGFNGIALRGLCELVDPSKITFIAQKFPRRALYLADLDDLIRDSLKYPAISRSIEDVAKEMTDEMMEKGQYSFIEVTPEEIKKIRQSMVEGGIFKQRIKLDTPEAFKEAMKKNDQM